MRECAWEEERGARVFNIKCPSLSLSHQKGKHIYIYRSVGYVPKGNVVRSK
jgi:hypothetical protein